MTETTGTDRIRWYDKTPGNGDVYNVASIGYVGTIEESAFIIYTPDELHADWLLSVRLIPGSMFLYADSADALKAGAEKWLSGFVASLGAIFPEGECHECGFRPPTHTHDKDCSRCQSAAPAAREKP